MRQPKILIADEPTGTLDPKHSWDIVRLLEKINKYGTTVLLTTHNVEIVNELKRRVITIDHGKIISDQARGSYNNDQENQSQSFATHEAPPPPDVDTVADLPLWRAQL